MKPVRPTPPVLVVLSYALAMMLATAAGAAEFRHSHEVDGVRLLVESPIVSSLNQLRIVAQGAGIVDSSVDLEVDGIVTGAESGDLDGNGLPEIYVLVNSVGSGSYGSMVGYAVEIDEPFSRIELPDILESPEASVGYMGHDRFMLTESALVRTFPVYRAGDTNSAPSGGVRELRYRLESHGGSPRLRLESLSRP